MQIIRSVAATLVLLAASASSYAGYLPATAKTIGILPLLPASAHLFRVAMLRFNNVCKPLDLKGANLEAAAYSAAAAALAARYKTTRLTAPAGAEIHTRNTEVMGAFKSFPSIAAQIRQMAHP